MIVEEKKQTSKQMVGSVGHRRSVIRQVEKIQVENQISFSLSRPIARYTTY